MGPTADDISLAKRPDRPIGFRAALVPSASAPLWFALVERSFPRAVNRSGTMIIWLIDIMMTDEVTIFDGERLCMYVNFLKNIFFGLKAL